MATRRPRLSSDSSSYDSSDACSYYGSVSSVIISDDDAGSNPCGATTGGRSIESRTFFDDVKVILSRHDGKLSKLEDDLSCMVRWLNRKFGFILKYESTSASVPNMWEEHEYPNVTNSDDPIMTEPLAKRVAMSSSPASNRTPLENDSYAEEVDDEVLEIMEDNGRQSEPGNEVVEDDKQLSPANDIRDKVSSMNQAPTEIPVVTANRKWLPTSTKISPRTVAPVKTVKRTRSVTKRVHSSDPKDSQRPSQCDTCGKFLKDPSSLRQHKKIHLNIRPFKCTEPDCGKSFRRKFHLQTHALIHRGIKDHQCGYCGRCFLLHKDLITHERIHTGERPFNCPEPECPKSFALKSHLVMHVRTHTGEKPYECDVCKKTFTQSNTLRLHKKKLHQDNISSVRQKPSKKSGPRRNRKKGKPESTAVSTTTTVVTPTPAKLPIYRNQSVAMLSAYGNIPSTSRLTPGLTILQQPMTIANHSFELLEPIDSTEKIIFTDSTMLSTLSNGGLNTVGVGNSVVPLLSSEILNFPQHVLIPRNNNNL